ncbi:MAG: DinB family protein [Caldilineaceae bacterium]
MTDREILLDLLGDFAGSLHWTIKDLPPSVLRWQPDTEANSIGVTVWHICRSFDVLGARILQNRLHTAEIWHTAGWAKRTGYDPHGIGFAGWGTLARFTRAEVEAIPTLSAAALLQYLGQTVDVLHTHLEGITPEMLYQPPAGWPDITHSRYEPETAYCAHSRHPDGYARTPTGEIKTLRGMWERL